MRAKADFKTLNACYRMQVIHNSSSKYQKKHQMKKTKTKQNKNLLE